MDTVEDLPLVEELHLGFGWVYVHVHGGERHRDVQHAGGEPAHHDLVAVGLLQSGGQGFGPDQPVIDKEDLIRPGAPGGGGPGDIAGNRQLLPFALHRDHLPRGLPAQDAVDGGQKRPVAGGLKLLFPVLDQPEGDLRMGQGLLLHGACHRGGLHRIPLHKLHAGRGVVEQVPHHNGGAHRAAGALTGQELAGLQPEAGALGVLGGTGQQIHPAHSGCGRQGLAAEAQGADGLQVLLPAELGGGMAQKGRLGVLPAHAAAVVADPEEGHAAVLDLDGDGLRTGVYGIFHQLLHHRGGPLHDLAGRDQVRQMGVQLHDFWHFRILLFEIHRIPNTSSRAMLLMIPCRKIEAQMDSLRS